MASEALRGIDDYEVFLTEKLTGWPSQRRVALAAAIAERWLPAYEAFSAAESWGDPASLHRSLDALWGQVQGRPLGAADRAHHLEQIRDCTPHMDDFDDAEEALTVCMILGEALECCGGEDRTLPYATRTALVAFEGLIPEWPVEPAAQRRIWQKGAVRKELQAQLKLIEQVEAMPGFDAEAVQALRRGIAGLKLKAVARPKPSAPPGLTNQTAFEQYRRYVESDLKGQVQGQPEPTDAYLFAITYFAYWMGRYSRRMQTINGRYGRLADELAQQALIARNRARDAAEKGLPEWDATAREMIEMALKNNSQINVLDAGAATTPHAYGPSLRRLWLEGRRLSQSDLDAWSHVRAWASHRPTAWPAEDRRKKQGLAHATPELGEKLARELAWQPSDDLDHPWTTAVDGVPWRIRVNDFPDDLMYSLIIGEKDVGSFHDWPGTWQRGIA